MGVEDKKKAPQRLHHSLALSASRSKGHADAHARPATGPACSFHRFEQKWPILVIAAPARGDHCCTSELPSLHRGLLFQAQSIHAPSKLIAPVLAYATVVG